MITLPTGETQTLEYDDKVSPTKNPPATIPVAHPETLLVRKKLLPPPPPEETQCETLPDLKHNSENAKLTPEVPSAHNKDFQLTVDRAPTEKIARRTTGAKEKPSPLKTETRIKRKMTDYFIGKCKPFEENEKEKRKEKIPEVSKQKKIEKEKKEIYKSVKLQSTKPKITPHKKTLRSLGTSIEKKKITRKIDPGLKKKGGRGQPTKIKIHEEKRVSALRKYFEDYIEEGKDRDRGRKLQDISAEEKPLNLGKFKLPSKQVINSTSLKSSHITATVLNHNSERSSLVEPKQTIPYQKSDEPGGEKKI